MGYLLLIAIVLVIVGYFIFRVISSGPKNEDDHQMISFVALLREPQRIEPIYVATAAKKAWGADLSYDSDEEGPDGYVVGDDSTPTLIVNYGERMIMVNNFPAPYVDDPQAVADTIPDLRLRGLVAEHTAWLSCDALGVESFDDEAVVRDWYRILGPLFSELVDDNCLAILTPLTGHLAPNMEETLEMLKSDDPLQALEDDAPVPVIQVSDDDPRMIAAVEEARRRWPEFVDAFEQRKGENFSVKAPVTAGDNTEFIWLDVTAIENEIIYGQLANDPVSLGNLKLGSKVRVPVEELNDWVVVRNGQPLGLFTAKVIADAANQHNDEK